VEERLAVLERENSALRRRCTRLQWGGVAMAVVLVGLAALPWTLGAPANPSKAGNPERGNAGDLAARRFLVKDANGAVRAELGIGAGDVVGLRFYFEGTKEQLTLTGGPDAGLNVYDRRGDLRTQVGTTGDGSPSLAMRAKELRPKVQLGVRANDLPFLDLYDAKDQVYSVIAKDGTPALPRAAP
jgi:hypothetical protein